MTTVTRSDGAGAAAAAGAPRREAPRAAATGAGAADCGGIDGRTARQTTVGQRPAGIERAERLRPSLQGIDQEVGRRLTAEKIDVRHVVAGQVAAGTEAADPAAGDEELARAKHAPAALARHDEVVGRAEELIEPDVEQTLQHARGRTVIRDERRVRGRRRIGSRLQFLDRIAVAVHRVQAGDIARGVVGDPDEPVGDELAADRERVVGEHLEEIGEPPDGVVPAIGRGERRPVVRRGDEHHAAELEALRQRPELAGALDQRPQHEPAARMRDDVERRRVFRQALQEQADVFFRRAVQGEVIERVDAIVVEILHAVEEVGRRQVAEAADGVRERAVNEEQRSLRRDRRAGEQLLVGERLPW